jgi:hypothetical protein
MIRFLIAKVQLDIVLHAEYPPAMRAQLGDLPKSPSDSYMKALERIKLSAEHPKKAAIHVLGWIYYSKRKLKMEELLEAVGLTTKINYKFEPCDLTDMCRGLVFYDKSSGIVQFIHSTVESFLNDCFGSRQTKDLIGDLRPYFLSDIELAKACLTYFSLDVFDNICPDIVSLQKRRSEYRFSNYAANHWAHHVRGVAENDRIVRHTLFEVFGADGKRESMEQFRTFRGNFGPATGKSLLHILIENRIASICMYPFSDDTLDTKSRYCFHSLPS